MFSLLGSPFPHPTPSRIWITISSGNLRDIFYSCINIAPHKMFRKCMERFATKQWFSLLVKEDWTFLKDSIRFPQALERTMFWGFFQPLRIYFFRLSSFTSFIFSNPMQMQQLTLLILSQIWLKWNKLNPKAMAEEGHGHRHLMFALAFFLIETKWKLFQERGCGANKPKTWNFNAFLGKKVSNLCPSYWKVKVTFSKEKNSL